MTRWDARHHLATPPRLFFTVGAVVLAAASAWWAAVLAGAPAAAGGASAAVPPVALHALAMTFGFFPMFFAGFQFSAGLKWLQVAPLPMRGLAPVALAHGLGWLVAAAAFQRQDAATFAAGMGLVAAGWTVAVLRLARRVHASRAPERLHARLFVIAGLAGAAAAWGCAAAVASARWPLVLALARAALWGFVGLTFVAAAHRMVPFVADTTFERVDRRWPRLLLATLALLLAGRAAAELVPTARAVVAPLQGLAGIALLAFAVRWEAARRVRTRMLRMLHAGFVWLGLALALGGLDALAAGAALAAASLHAFAAGFLGTTALALVSRVAAAQAGRTVAVDDRLWIAFLLLQVAVALRVAAAVFGAPWMLAVAAFAWAGTWLPWAVRTARMLGQR